MVTTPGWARTATADDVDWFVENPKKTSTNPRMRRGPWMRRPEGLLALCLACVGSRLVFESVIFPYYLLATSVVFFILDLVARRSPHRSLAWCAGSAFFVAVHPGNQAVNAIGTLAFAAWAVAAGILEVLRLSRGEQASSSAIPVSSDTA